MASRPTPSGFVKGLQTEGGSLFYAVGNALLTIWGMVIIILLA